MGDTRTNHTLFGGFLLENQTTAIFFDDQGDMIEVQTHNTELKNRLTEYALKYPKECRQTDDDEQGGLTFEIRKGRLSFRLTAPYSKERCQKCSDLAKKHTQNLKGAQK